MSRHAKKLNNRGFTIVELMIATAVLSIILLMATVIITGISNLYYKGINTARIQTATRTTVDEIAQNIQLSGKAYPNPPDPAQPQGVNNPGAVCANGYRYTYVRGIEIGTGSPHVLWRDAYVVSGGSCPPVSGWPNPTSSGQELMPPKSRLTQFDVSPDASNTAYVVTVNMAYGDDDQLCNTSAIAGDACGGGATMAYPDDYIGTTVVCRSGSGNQFCATTNLTTTVLPRLVGG